MISNRSGCRHGDARTPQQIRRPRWFVCEIAYKPHPTNSPRTHCRARGTADRMWRFREAARSSAHAGPGRLVGIISYDDALRALAA